MNDKMSTSSGKCTPIIRDSAAGHSNDGGTTPAPKVGGILSHACKKPRGGTKTAGVPAYVLTVKNALQ